MFSIIFADLNATAFLASFISMLSCIGIEFTLAFNNNIITFL